MSTLKHRNPDEHSYLKDSRLLVLTIVTVLLAGVFSFHALPRMEDPVLTERAALVNTRVPGASARRVESLVTEVSFSGFVNLMK